MKILDLLTEAKFSSTIYAYHATPKENFRSILKNGLVANFSSEGYGSDDTSHAGYSLTALKGVYFTRRSKDAMNIAAYIGDSIIVVAKLQPKQLELDEDRMVDEMLNEASFVNHIKRLLRKIEKEQGSILEPRSLLKSAEIQTLVDEHIRTIMKTNLRNSKAILRDYIIGNLKRYFITVTEFLIIQYRHRNFDDENLPNETKLKNSQNKMTQILRSAIHTNEDTHSTFKINTRIGFSGANKIVGFYNPMTGAGWGDTGELREEVIRVVSAPMRVFDSV